HAKGVLGCRKRRARRFAESAVAVAQQDSDVRTFKVRGYNICVAVAIEVGSAQPLVGMATNGEHGSWRSKPSAAVAEEDFDLVFAPAINREIQVAVVVEIAQRNAVRMRLAFHRDWRGRRRREAAIAFAQQNGYMLRAMVRDGEIGDAIVVEVAYTDVGGTAAGSGER